MVEHLNNFLEHPRDRAFFPELPDRPNTASDGS